MPRQEAPLSSVSKTYALALGHEGCQLSLGAKILPPSNGSVSNPAPFSLAATSLSPRAMASFTSTKTPSEYRSKEPATAKSPPSDSTPFITNTPEKPIQLPRRARNRSVVLSVNEVRKIAQGLRTKSNRSSDETETFVESDASCASSADPVLKQPTKSKNDVKLPEKYEMLRELFDSMESSIRLLRLKGTMSTFTNICPKIEALTGRRFSYGHLAQLKYILPEAISVKKILVRDERTLCMKPDLQVALQLDVVKKGCDCKSGSSYMILSKMFHARLLDFAKEHPEGDEVPEGMLPDPFNKTKPSLLSNAAEPGGHQLPPLSFETVIQQPSHMSKSFKRWFSQRVPVSTSQETRQQASTDPITLVTSERSSLCPNNQPSDKKIHASFNQCSAKFSLKPPISKKSLTSTPSKVQLPHLDPPETHKQGIAMKNEDYDAQNAMDHIEGTPTKLISTPLKLMTVTPESQTPKRCRPGSNSPYNDSASPNRSVLRPIPARSLEFNTPIKKNKCEGENNERGISAADADVIKFLPETLLQSIRDKESEAMEERSQGVAEARRRQQMIACLPKLFDMIHLIFQSMKRSVITKQELMHMIIANNFDIVDRGEVEEQLKLLQELVPDWISGKMSLSGDFLFCINKMSSPESIHARLAEAE